MVFLVAIVVSACSFQKPWSVEEVTGHLPDLDFFPGGGKGAPVRAKIHEGKILLMYMDFYKLQAECTVSMARPVKNTAGCPAVFLRFDAVVVMAH